MIPGELTLLTHYPARHLIKKDVMGGVQLIYDFPNGYGASVVRHDFSYGSKEGLFELAVLNKGTITYETSVADNVIGWMSVSDVLETLDKIKELPKSKKLKKSSKIKKSEEK